VCLTSTFEAAGDVLMGETINPNEILQTEKVSRRSKRIQRVLSLMNSESEWPFYHCRGSRDRFCPQRNLRYTGLITNRSHCPTISDMLSAADMQTARRRMEMEMESIEISTKSRRPASDLQIDRRVMESVQTAIPSLQISRQM
jgi:hypothetical protein